MLIMKGTMPAERLGPQQKDGGSMRTMERDVIACSDVDRERIIFLRGIRPIACVTRQPALTQWVALAVVTLQYLDGPARRMVAETGVTEAQALDALHDRLADMFDEAEVTTLPYVVPGEQSIHQIV